MITSQLVIVPFCKVELRLEQDLQHAKLHIDACRRGIDENRIEGNGPDLKEKSGLNG